MSTQGNKKFTLSTDTDLHFDMLADHSKLKILPNLVENKSNIVSVSGDGAKSVDSDDIIDNDVNSDSLKFNESSDENENKNYDKNEYEKQKMTYNYEKKMKEKDYSEKKRSDSEDYESDESNRKTTEDKERERKKTLSDFYDMDDVPFHLLDEQTRKFKKMEKYAELLAIKNTGIKLTKEYNLNSDYEEMCFEVQYWTNFQKKKDAINLGKNFMMNAVTALEFMNERYDPFSLKLKGWSDQMQIGIEGYNNVFGQLYEKWKGSGREMEPEIKLILMVSASAVSFHASKKMAESLPGLDKVLESNPELLGKLQGVINENISKGNAEPKKTEEDSQLKMYEQMQQLKKQQKKFSEIKKRQEDIESNTSRLQEQLNKNKSQPEQPNGNNIQNILEKIRAQNAVDDADQVLNASTSSSDTDERVSVQSTLGKEEIDNSSNSDKHNDLTLTLGSDGKPKRRRRKGKQTITIST